MAKRELFQFNNNRSVRFNLDNFALPVVISKKKNTIYTQRLVGLRGTKRKLLPPIVAVDKHGYDFAVRWGHFVFAANQHGLYYADEYALNFVPLDLSVCPRQICIANNRLFIIAMDQRRLIYSENLQKEWGPDNFFVGAFQLPDNYGLCLDLACYRNQLLAICDNGLLLVNKSLALTHLSDDSELLKANLNVVSEPVWESDWFSLGYATDTQTLREVFLKTDTPLTMIIESNQTQRTVTIGAADRVQKIKINLNGDQFKIKLLIEQVNDCCVSDLSAIITYGKRRTV